MTDYAVVRALRDEWAALSKRYTHGAFNEKSRGNTTQAAEYMRQANSDQEKADALTALLRDADRLTAAAEERDELRMQLHGANEARRDLRESLDALLSAGPTAAQQRAEAALTAAAVREAKLRQDAERYRWLRNEARSVDWSRSHPESVMLVYGEPVPMQSHTTYCRNSPANMDAEIDAALAAATEDRA